MDPLKLLSRSTGLSKSGKKRAQYNTPSTGPNAQPQLYPAVEGSEEQQSRASRKRKRGQALPTISDAGPGGLNFFGAPYESTSVAPVIKPAHVSDFGRFRDGEMTIRDDSTLSVRSPATRLSGEEARAILKQHKLKITWLNAKVLARKDGRQSKDKSKSKAEKPQLFPQPLASFRELRERYGVPSRVVGNIEDQGYITPTEVQLGALPLLLDSADSFLPGSSNVVAAGSDSAQRADLLTVAPTGSGKTLAFMIPLLHRIYYTRHSGGETSHNPSAIVLAPTKELVGQIVNEGRKLAGGTGIRVAQLRKGMVLPVGGDQAPDAVSDGQRVKAEIVVSAPGLLHSILGEKGGLKHANLSTVRFLVLDEADVLLDPLFREQTLGVWSRLSNSGLRVTLWSATMGSNIEELARSTINARRERLAAEHGGHVREGPLVRLVVGLKDSAVPNVQHKLIYAATEQGKLMGLRQLLHPAAVFKDAGAPLLPPFLVFTQTIERAIALHSELLYDIPAEAGGISRVAVLHSDLSDAARDIIMTRFRKGDIWVLITTDLLSRGVDFRGVNGVVNYDIPTSSAAYVHRVGRTGRAGREGGVAVTLYSKEDVPYLKHVANVVAAAQKQKGVIADGGMQQWLLDALPSLSKQDKQKFKKRGIESRTARGKEADPKAARKARISSKSGFVRRAENSRRGAILGTQRRLQAEVASDAGEETAFRGFD